MRPLTWLKKPPVVGVGPIEDQAPPTGGPACGVAAAIASIGWRTSLLFGFHHALHMLEGLEAQRQRECGRLRSCAACRTIPRALRMSSGLSPSFHSSAALDCSAGARTLSGAPGFSFGETSLRLGRQNDWERSIFPGRGRCRPRLSRTETKSKAPRHRLIVGSFMIYPTQPIRVERVQPETRENVVTIG